jgi:hypothetical protein
MAFLILTTVWGGETPGVQIPVDQVIERIAPIFVVNAVVVLLFYWRYRINYQRRLLAASGAQRLSGGYPTTSLPAAPVASAPVRSEAMGRE